LSQNPACSVCAAPIVGRAPKHISRVNRLFCSRKCAAEWRHGPNNPAFSGGMVERTCATCGSLFHIKRNILKRGGRAGTYCSRNCAIRRGEEHPRSRNLPTVPCGHCGTPVKLRHSGQVGARVFCCRPCADYAHRALMSGSKNPNYTHGHGAEDYPAEFRKIAPQIRKRDHYCCRICGKIRSQMRWVPDVHHIDHDKMNNTPGNLISLCRECHAHAHRKRSRWAAVQELLLKVLSGFLPPIGSSISGLLDTTITSPTESSSITATTHSKLPTVTQTPKLLQ